MPPAFGGYSEPGAACQVQEKGFSSVLFGDREGIKSWEQKETEGIPQREVKCFFICIEEQTGGYRKQH